jgi:hypothetical protein
MFDHLHRSRGLSISEIRSHNPASIPVRHFLDPEPEESRPTVTTLVRAIKAKREWSNGQLAAAMGTHCNHVQRMATGQQKGCYPETQAKLRAVIRDDAELMRIYYRVDWGQAAKERMR